MRILATTAAVMTATALTGCMSPRAQANIAQALTDASTQISAVQQDVSALQDQLDSLRQIVARQDTIIRRLATLNNMPLAQP